MATTKTTEKKEGQKEDSWYETIQGKGYGEMLLEPPSSEYIPLRLVALYKFGLSTTKLQFGPNGKSRVLPGVLANVPADPFRVTEREQYIGFSNLKIKEKGKIPLFDIVPSEVSCYGIILSSAPVVMRGEGHLEGTAVRMAEGTIGFSFYATRKLEINAGWVIAYARVVK